MRGKMVNVKAHVCVYERFIILSTCWSTLVWQETTQKLNCNSSLIHQAKMGVWGWSPSPRNLTQRSSKQWRTWIPSPSSSFQMCTLVICREPDRWDKLVSVSCLSEGHEVTPWSHSQSRAHDQAVSGSLCQGQVLQRTPGICEVGWNCSQKRHLVH